jgi:hypothetical protein
MRHGPCVPSPTVCRMGTHYCRLRTARPQRRSPWCGRNAPWPYAQFGCRADDHRPGPICLEWDRLHTYPDERLPRCWVPDTGRGLPGADCDGNPVRTSGHPEARIPRSEETPLRRMGGSVWGSAYPDQTPIRRGFTNPEIPNGRAERICGGLRGATGDFNRRRRDGRASQRTRGLWNRYRYAARSANPMIGGWRIGSGRTRLNALTARELRPIDAAHSDTTPELAVSCRGALPLPNWSGLVASNRCRVTARARPPVGSSFTGRDGWAT